MSAAIQAGIPFGVKFAHIHGGETTLGAIDNIYRHQITHASKLHFTATDFFYNKVAELTGSEDNVYLVGSLSLDGIEKFKPIDKQLFYNEFKIPKEEFALVTFHPETLSTKTNEVLALEMSAALAQISRNLFLVITMPNADTYGSIYRKEIKKIEKQFSDKIKCIESFGKENYFSAMYYSRLLIGNTSSGILEAASFGKYVVNVGDRQKGRLQSDNVINTPFNKNSIVDAVNQILSFDNFKGVNIYYQEKPALNIINQLKRNYARI
jgi:GDP/UDP-N,N'-diacetylbacillosamine 2-epimerase (hydrolysing)